jgi:hypothetical protein
LIQTFASKVSKSVDYIPCCERRFEMELASSFDYHYWYYVLVLRHLLERLGREHTLALWADAFRAYDDALLEEILSSGWEAVEDGQGEGFEESISESLADLFPSPVEGVARAEARRLVDSAPPFAQIRRKLPAPNMKRESTTYEALHLFRDGLALLAEVLIEDYGKQGEFLFYDAMLEELAESPAETVPVEKFMSRRQARFRTKPDKPDMFSAGLEVEFIRASDTEVVHRVTECEWARYYQERHPRVGYLLACCMDNAVYRSLNPRIRLQRTSTLMEGGTACDFRVYALEAATDTAGRESGA